MTTGLVLEKFDARRAMRLVEDGFGHFPDKAAWESGP
jgi:hypothetical protein